MFIRVNKIASIVLLLNCSLVWAESGDSFEMTRQKDALGRKMGFSQLMTNPVYAVLKAITWITVLSQEVSAVRAVIDGGMTNSDTPDVSPETELYVGGMRIWQKEMKWENGAFSFNYSVPPVEKRVPVVSYPIGPVLLRVDAGARLEAHVSASAMIGVAYPTQFSSLSATLKPQIRASAFVEGYAKMIVIRAGVGGMVVLLDAALEGKAMFVMDGRKPLITYSAYVSSLFGRFFMFIDVFKFSRFRWKRVIDEDLINWSGYCDKTEDTQCPVR